MYSELSMEAFGLPVKRRWSQALYKWIGKRWGRMGIGISFFQRGKGAGKCSCMGEYLGKGLGEFAWCTRGKRIMTERTERQGGLPGPELVVSFCEGFHRMCPRIQSWGDMTGT